MHDYNYLLHYIVVVEHVLHCYNIDGQSNTICDVRKIQLCSMAFDTNNTICVFTHKHYSHYTKRQALIKKKEQINN